MSVAPLKVRDEMLRRIHAHGVETTRTSAAGRCSAATATTRGK